jgi:hypothetical protein
MSSGNRARMEAGIGVRFERATYSAREGFIIVHDGKKRDREIATEQAELELCVCCEPKGHQGVVAWKESTLQAGRPKPRAGAAILENDFDIAWQGEYSHWMTKVTLPPHLNGDSALNQRCSNTFQGRIECFERLAL